jgi:hypoxanthine phosphoribosyltransferase
MLPSVAMNATTVDILISIHLVCVLKGGFVFLADLVRFMGDRVTMDFIAVSSYGKGTRSSGEVRMLKDLDAGIEGRDVVIVEDIVDTGLTLTYLQEILRARAPRSLRTACLLSKPSRRRWTFTSTTSASPSPTASSSATASTTTSATATSLHRRAHGSGRLNHDEAFRLTFSTASRTSAAAARASARTARLVERQHPSRISTRPFTIVVSHVVAARDVDQVRDRVVHRRLARRPVSHDDEVGALAHLERADAIRQARAARAPPMVAISSASGRGSARGSLRTSLCSNAACRIASNMSRSLLLAAPSVPSPR